MQAERAPTNVSSTYTTTKTARAEHLRMCYSKTTNKTTAAALMLQPERANGIQFAAVLFE